MLRKIWWPIIFFWALFPKVTFAGKITDYIPLLNPSDSAYTYFYDGSQPIGNRDRTVSIGAMRTLFTTGSWVPTTRTVNGYALSSNIALSAADVSAVPTTRTVNGYALSSNISLGASDVGLGSVTNTQQMPLSYLDIDANLTANSDTRVPSQAAVKSYVDNAAPALTWGSITGTLSFQADLNTALNAKVPTVRTVNGYALSSNVLLVASDVGLGSVSDVAQLPLSYLDTDVNMAANSNTKVPSQAAVVAYVAANGGGGGGVWGTITGTLSQQLDLQAALDAKLSLTNLPSLSVNNELAVFSGTTGKILTRATGTGYAYITNGVLGTSANGSTFTTLNASNLSSGTVAAARGGAGTVSGLMYANGSGAVSAATSTQVNTAIGYTPMNSTAFSGTSKITVGTTQPVSPSAGDIWFDTTGL